MNSDSETPHELVVLVHGVLMRAGSMLRIGRKLERESTYHCERFGYRSVRCTLDENAKALEAFVAAKLEHHRRVHFVGHSLGGLVALRMISQAGALRIGRTVCLGSPLRGSQTAQVLNRSKFGRGVIGKSLSEEVSAEGVAQWGEAVVHEYEVGVIAGTRPRGVGRLFSSFNSDNDGTVSVNETRLNGLTDHLCLPISHTGMLVDDEVVSHIASFLRTGRFRSEDTPTRATLNG